MRTTQYAPNQCMPPSEVAVHALAQAPPSAELVLPHSADEPHLRLLLHAHGLSDRCTFARARSCSSPAFSTLQSHAGALQPDSFATVVEGLWDGVLPDEVAKPAPVELGGQRVVVLTNYPAHYRIPLFNALDRRLRAAGVEEFRVMFLHEADAPRPWLTDGSEHLFKSEYLQTFSLPIRQRAPRVPIALDRRLRDAAPSIVLVAGLSPLFAERAIRAARKLGARIGVWSGETPEMSTAKQRLRSITRRRLVENLDFAIVYGIRAAVYLRGLRRNLPIVIGRNTAPVPENLGARTERQSSLRTVAIGDLASPRKGADVIISALQAAPDLSVTVDFIGGGVLLPDLQRLAAQDPRIEFLGSLPPREVALRLSAFDAAVFPTRSDVFGLALVETMGSGLPTIVASAAGAVSDLAVDQRNALVLDTHDPSLWAKALRALVEERETASLIGAAARHTIQARWTIEKSAAAMAEGLRLGVL